MIQRYDMHYLTNELDKTKNGRYVLYEDYLEAIAGKDAEISGHKEATESLLAEIHRLDAELKVAELKAKDESESLSKIISSFYDDCKRLKEDA